MCGCLVGAFLIWKLPLGWSWRPVDAQLDEKGAQMLRGGLGNGFGHGSMRIWPRDPSEVCMDTCARKLSTAM